MKIVLDLPDWVDERNIRVFAGIELVARRYKYQRWEIKTARCIRCGRCCADLTPAHVFPIVAGQCIHLRKQPGKDNDQWLCGLGINRPFGCSASTCTLDYCSVRFETVAQCPGVPDED